MSTAIQLPSSFNASANAQIIDNNEVYNTLPPAPVFVKPEPKPIVIQESEPVKTTFRTAAATKGAVDDTVSKQWANRPDEQRYTDLYAMREAIGKRFTQSRQVDINYKDILFDGAGSDIMLNLNGNNVALNNYTFSQLCATHRLPVEYMRKLPSDLAAINMQHAVKSLPNESVKALITDGELRAITSKTYGRVWDYQAVDQVIKVAGNGVNDTCWKVPGVINWGTSNGVTVEYNPFVDVTKETTTLYASDRDVYIFLVDDTHPIEVGKLDNGEPDLMFRGFIVWNSETGDKTFGISTMLMRGVCANRNIWGVEGKQGLQMRHSVTAPERFATQAYPMLAAYALSSSAGVVNKVRNAKNAIIARTDEERMSFLTDKMLLSVALSEKVLLSCTNEEQHPMTSVWDAVQGITAHARTIRHTDNRVALELKAGKLMDKIEA
jgi:hypothetical protein